jgi:hypothetical protein
MAISGPKIQTPTPLTPIMDETGNLHPYWQSFFHSAQNTIYAGTRSGPTASRPTSVLDGRYIGMPYFDTTLGLTVFLKIASTNVWVKGDGTPA